MTPDELHELAAAHAVDALDAAERAEFEAHLAGCARCQAEVAALREVVAELAWAEAVPVPPALRARVLAAVDDVAQVAPADAAAAPPAGPPPPAPTSLADHRSRRRRPGRGAQLVAAAAVVVALLSAGLAIDARREVDRLEEVAALAEAPDLTSAALVGGDGDVHVTWSEDEGRAVLFADGVAPAPDGRTYQLWLVRSGTPRPAGLFTAEDGDATLALDELPAPGDVLALTVEPEGGSPAPTTTPIRASDPV